MRKGMQTEISITQEGNEGRISLSNATEEIGYLTYRLGEEHTLIAEHTVVYEAYRGQGMAEQLVEVLRLHCLKHHYRLVPACSYIRRLAERTPQLAVLCDTAERTVDRESHTS